MEGKGQSHGGRGLSRPRGPALLPRSCWSCLASHQSGVWDYLVLEHWHYFQSLKRLTLVSINTHLLPSLHKGEPWWESVVQTARTCPLSPRGPPFSKIATTSKKKMLMLLSPFLWTKIPATPVVCLGGLPEGNVSNLSWGTSPKVWFTSSDPGIPASIENRPTLKQESFLRGNVMQLSALPLNRGSPRGQAKGSAYLQYLNS